MPGFEVPDHVRPIRDQVLAFVRERVEPAEAVLHEGGPEAATLLTAFFAERRGGA